MNRITFQDDEPVEIFGDRDVVGDLSMERKINSPVLRLSFQITAFYLGILMPIVCLLIASGGGLTHRSDRWQSGELRTFALLLLEMPATLPALPLMLTSMIALGFSEIRPQSRELTIIRLAIYLGVLISFQYLWYSMVASMFAPVLMSGLLIWPAIFAISLTFVWCFRKLSRIMVLTTAIAVLLSLGLNLPSDFNFVSFCGFWILAGSAFGAPFGCFITYALAANRLRGKSSPTRYCVPSLVAIGTAALAWLTATSASILLMLDKYSRLPVTQPSSCFVCSAAAYGHRRIVLAKPVLVHGQTHMINRQLQRLKFLEIVLMVATPALHRVLRTVYNCVGPLIARPARSNRWYADLCYFILKPAEWFSLLVQVIARVPRSQVKAIYTGLEVEIGE